MFFREISPFLLATETHYNMAWKKYQIGNQVKVKSAWIYSKDRNFSFMDALLLLPLALRLAMFKWESGLGSTSSHSVIYTVVIHCSISISYHCPFKLPVFVGTVMALV
jgi:hypothetical protein